MTTALYRRYRPETFQEVIGQEHVTEPLMAALRADRVTHAYLFSGPRGCGKTTSARILARCLNCAEGPTDTPCGTCPSCVELARGGSGSLDVVEIDAASHNGVDDARELRERASFAPARDRYKIFILDEAHMVTPQGFNALLKLVEEPPPHVKFIFATTEPDKVIGTIRSRTHHYPFRLVPPEHLLAYLEQLCTTEGVRVGGGVLPMVVRAGGGSVRDTLSVLDQLIAGAQDGALDYDRAVALLGYTDAALLDDVVDAVAARDGASLFRVVDRVIGSGHDPRRFVEDLLQRLRDLVVIVMAGEHAAAALRGVLADQLDRMRAQAHHLGAAQVTRAADLVNAALTEMSGATSPRLQLELLCARILLPGADDGDAGYGARLDRLERQVTSGVPVTSIAGSVPAAGTPAPAPAASAIPPVAPGASGAPAPDASATSATATALAATAAAPAPSGATAPAPAGPAASRLPAQDVPQGGRSGSAPRPGATTSAPPAGRPDAPRRPAAPGAPAPAATPPVAAPGGPEHSGADAEMVRNRWSEVVATLARMKRATWTLVSQNAHVGELSGGVLRLVFSTPGLATAFRNGSHAGAVQQALAETLGVRARIEAVTADGAGGPGAAGRVAPAGPGAAPGSTATPGSVPSAATPPSAVTSARASWASPPSAGSATPPSAGSATPPSAGSPADAGPPSLPAPSAGGAATRPGRAGGTVAPRQPGAEDDYPLPPEPTDDDPGPAAAYDDAPAVAFTGAAPAAAARFGSAPAAPAVPVPRPTVSPADDVASLDDPDAEGSGMVGATLVAKVLGGTVIEELSVPPQGAM
ncbi:DNA polymerase III subunit gamma and tau [Georgenia yuyongxinii]